jgi:hypothetical protein
MDLTSFPLKMEQTLTRPMELMVTKVKMVLEMVMGLNMVMILIMGTIPKT